MTLSRLRVVLVVALATISLAIELSNLYFFKAQNYNFAFDVTGGVVRGTLPAAKKAGIQSGDRVNYAAMPVEDRYSSLGRAPPDGRTVTFHFDRRGGAPYTATVTSFYSPPGDGGPGDWLWLVAVKKSVALVLIIFGSALFLTRPNLLSGAVFTLALGVGMSIGFPFGYSFLPARPYLALEAVSNVFRNLAVLAFLALAVWLGGRRPVTLRGLLPLLALPAAYFAVLLIGNIHNVVLGYPLDSPDLPKSLPLGKMKDVAAVGFLTLAFLWQTGRPLSVRRVLPALIVPALFVVLLAAAQFRDAFALQALPTALLIAVESKALHVAGAILLVATALRRSTTAGERLTAASLAFAGISALPAGPLGLQLVDMFGPIGGAISGLGGTFMALGALVVVFVIVRERVVDTGLIMSRILSYGAVSAAIIAVLGLMNWTFAAQFAAFPLAVPGEIVAAVIIGFRFSGLRDVANALSLADVDAQTATVQARTVDARDALVRALGLAERTGQTGLLAEVRARCAFSAWFDGDDEAFTRHSEVVRRALGARSMRGLGAFARAAVSGGAVRFDQSDLPEWKARALLVAYDRAEDAFVARERAQEALAAANESALPWLRILALLALAEVSPNEHKQLLDSAIETARDAGWLVVGKSLTALRSGARDAGMLQPFVDRRLRKIRPARPTLEVSFITGDVLVLGKRVQLHGKGLALLFTVASVKTAINADELLDAVWPEADGDAARNAFRVCLHRLRKDAGDQRIIRHVGKAYALSPGADVDLWRLQDLLAQCAQSDKREHLAELERFCTAFIDGHERRATLGSWFEPFERLLSRKVEEAQRILEARPASAMSR